MINFIKSKILNDNGSTTTESTTTESTTSPTTRPTTTNPSDVKCKNGHGYYSDTASGCKKFYICVSLPNGGYNTVYFNCPSGLLFDDKIKSCNYPSQVSC